MESFQRALEAITITSCYPKIPATGKAKKGESAIVKDAEVKGLEK